jgi:L-alanine-DL-glutamate epimerase-like enolase superfamily enzyme
MPLPDRRRNVFPLGSWFCFALMHFSTTALADDDPMTAVQLLSSYSGGDASGYERYFRFTESGRIVGIEIHAVGNEATTARYSGHDEEAYWEVNNILRITTADGFEGVSGVDSYYFGAFSDEHLQALKDVATELAGLRILDPVEAGRRLRERRPDVTDAVLSSIDIALWDLAGQKAGKPLYRILGAKRESIEPYASLPYYEKLTQYVDAVNEYAGLGYSTFKFHVWGEIEKDVELVKLIQATFQDSSFRFMVDLESVYGFDDALALGDVMDDGLFVLYEAPLNDALLDEYAALRRRLDVALVPAGYTHYSPQFLEQGIAAGAWDAGRFDATTVGGISPALVLLKIANDAGLPLEIQSWGHSLTQVANLHLMLANEHTRYFEAPMPGAAFEFGMQNADRLSEGRVSAPDRPGLGIGVDWDRLADADFHEFVVLDYASTSE